MKNKNLTPYFDGTKKRIQLYDILYSIMYDRFVQVNYDKISKSYYGKLYGNKIKFDKSFHSISKHTLYFIVTNKFKKIYYDTKHRINN